MTYFNNITSLSELKKQYRVLTLANHPDRGGNTESMQHINAEFEKLFNIWKDRPEMESTTTGYENDYNHATAREYTQRVYNEYRWCGENYKGQGNKEITAAVRQWLKATYPDYKFSVRLEHYSSIYVSLLIADFEIFKDKPSEGICERINHYWIDDDKELTDRAKEVFTNVRNRLMSYNYDDSDIMTDYFNTNFYINLYIGSSTKPYHIEIPKSRRTGGNVSPEFKRPEGPAHKAIRKALNKAYFNQIVSGRTNELITVLGEEHTYSTEARFYPLSYSSPKQAQKRIDKLTAAGILCRATSWNGGYIEFLGYTPEVEQALAAEDRTADAAQKEWERQQQPTNESKEETPTYEDSEKSQVQESPSAPSSFLLVDYSEKAIALFGNTRAIKDQLKELGGRFNPGLNDGGSKRAGWIFSKRKETELRSLLNSVAV